MDNGLNITNQNVSDSLNASEIIAYHVLFMVIITFPMTIINSIIIYALLLEKSTSKPIRIVLVNTPIACNIVAISLFINQVLSLIGSIFGINPPSGLCNFVLLCLLLGGVGRLSFMALYSITVLLIVRFKVATLKPMLILISVASVWLVVCLFGVWYLIAFDSVFDQVSCVPMPRNGATGLVFTVVYSIAFGLFCLIITLTVPFVIMCYVKKHTVDAADSKIAIALAKFALFLLIGNSINFASEILPSILATIVVGNTSSSTLGVISMVVLAVVVASLIPPPILILVYFKGVRNRAFSCLKKKSFTNTDTSKKISATLQTEESIN